MTTRRQLSTHAGPAAVAGALVGFLLSACGPPGGAGSTASTSSATSTPPPATVTVTTTVTARPTATRPVPTTPVRPTIDPSPTTPPPARDAPAIPRSAQDYGIAFVTAWVKGDRARVTQLGTESAAKAASATRVDRAPRFERCEGAAGSSYCTWAGDAYTLQLRILNETASRGQLHAVTEVAFRH